MEHFGSVFLADNGSSSFNRNMWESTSMHPPAVPWPLFTDTPSTSHSEFPNCNMYLHFHGTTRAHSTPLDRFRYNYEPAMFSPYISGVPPLVPAMPLTTNAKSAQNDNTRKLTCEICKKMFLRPSALKVHMRIHNGEKPFQCTHCPRAFTQSGNLTVHLRMHTGERPFMCTFCGKGFSQSNTVRVHLRTHTGEKPFQCMECLKCFSDRSTLIKHHRVHVNAGVRQNTDSQSLDLQWNLH